MSKYFIDGLRETEEDGIFSVDDDEAEFWTVCRRDHDGFGMAMFDLCIKEEAEKLVQVLEERDALLLENAAMQKIINSVTDLDNEPKYHSEGMGSGLEDRGITDKYEAMQYGWDEAMDRIYGDVIPNAEELESEFPTTDAALAAIQAQAIEDAVKKVLFVDTVASTVVISQLLRAYAAELREAK
jgi:hypothetical protein